MENRNEVIALFRDKYAYLKTVYPSVGPFDEAGIYQNPDGGWQLDLPPCAAISLRPDADEPHEVHGAICERWYKEGEAFNEADEKGWLGYPISDEKSWEELVTPPPPRFYYVLSRPWTPCKIPVYNARSIFQFGEILYNRGLSWETLQEHHIYSSEIISEIMSSFEGHPPYVFQIQNPRAWVPLEPQNQTICSRSYDARNHIPSDASVCARGVQSRPH